MELVSKTKTLSRDEARELFTLLGKVWKENGSELCTNEFYNPSTLENKEMRNTRSAAITLEDYLRKNYTKCLDKKDVW